MSRPIPYTERERFELWMSAVAVGLWAALAFGMALVVAT